MNVSMSLAGLASRHAFGLPVSMVEALRGNDARALRDFMGFRASLIAGDPFTYVRFSDGELDILRQRRLTLALDRRFLNGTTTAAKYASYDTKDFDPIRDTYLMETLRTAATFRAPGYWKGIPTKHNQRVSDKDWMISLNGGTDEGLTFADLFVNAMYPRFRREILPLLVRRSDVVVVGNFRMKVDLLNPTWKLAPIPDNAFASAEDVIEDVLATISDRPSSPVVLSSASSLTNILGYRLLAIRPDATFIDVGTALHPLAGMGSSDRWYHLEVAPWTSASWKRKAWYLSSRGRYLRW